MINPEKKIYIKVPFLSLCFKSDHNELLFELLLFFLENIGNTLEKSFGPISHAITKILSYTESFNRKPRETFKEQNQETTNECQNDKKDITYEG